MMPWGVGGTMRPQIDSATGLTSYSGVDSAPFGGRLGFRSGASSVIPTSDLYYYRWEYRPQSGGSWTDFDEEVRVHYVKEVLGFLPSFPTMKLGPFDVGPVGPGMLETDAIPIGGCKECEESGGLERDVAFGARSRAVRQRCRILDDQRHGEQHGPLPVHGG